MRISDWSSDVCSSDLLAGGIVERGDHCLQRVRLGGDLGVEGLGGDDGPPWHLHQLGIDADPGLRQPAVVVDRLQLAQFALQDEIGAQADGFPPRSEEHTSELQSLMRISYAVFCLRKKTSKHNTSS